MTASERRTQLVGVAKQVFAELGYDGASIEEIAARAKVSKPVIYEHFGGKEGIYAVVVDRESAALLQMITSRLGPDVGARQQIHESAMAFLDYIEADPAGFRVLTRDTPSGSSGVAGGSMAGLLSDVAAKAEGILAGFFAEAEIDTSVSPLYAHALVGMIVHVGAWWSEVREPSKEEVAGHLTALSYLGLARLPKEPHRLGR
ncbi:TetR/AcrR family transcriptional regulator [Egibacter rhizosphaerae]|uniref:TetR/AcrR family transcriptional regulator n=2 Tax=Egibacter rhizosphaerae TaxID=1670831 RepID=A0A411YLP3_9ACTN|nr:TetR/AcrR family transcriptional regulator [Egibacter rhizosphaerae]